MKLLRGDEALVALRALLARGGGLPAVEVDPGARSGEPLQLLAVAAGDEAVLVDVRATPGCGAVLAAAAPLGADDAKAVHRALLRAGEKGADRWACTRLTSLLLAGGRDRKHDLASLATSLGMSPPPAADAGFDALAARATAVAAVIRGQIPAIKADGLGWVSKIEAAAVAPIAELEHNGMCVDAPEWRKLSHEAEAERAALRAELGKHFAAVAGSDLFGGAAINLDADAELKRALDALGFPVPNVRRETLADLPSPLGPPLRRYRELSKIVSAYGESFLTHVAADGRLHPVFEQIGASTGRMACHSPNLQAVLKDSGFRDCFRCAPERRLVIADYATCELRILAQMSGDPVFGDAFARGDDLHSTVATSLFGVPVSKSENPELRQRTKAINFGLVYGMGAGGLARQLDTDLDQAQKLLDKYFQTFPKIRAYLDGAAREALKRGYARTLTGRRLYLDPGSDRGERAAAERVAKNMPIQGTSADITKIALARLRAALVAFSGARLVNAVHDELVVECEAAEAEAVAAVVAREMEAAGAEVVPDIRLAVDTEVGQVWNK